MKVNDSWLKNSIPYVIKSSPETKINAELNQGGTYRLSRDFVPV